MQTPNIAILIGLANSIMDAPEGKDGTTTISLEKEVRERFIEAAKNALQEMQQISVYVAANQAPTFDMFAAAALQGVSVMPNVDEEGNPVHEYELVAGHAAMYAMHMLRAREEYIAAKVEAEAEKAAEEEPEPEKEEEKPPAEVLTTPVPDTAIEAE